MSGAFLLTSLIVVASPGIGVLYTVAAGLSRGRRASVVAAFGCTLGIVPHMVATITGLAAVMRTSETAFQVVKYLGVAYLLVMAWTTLRDREAIVVEPTAAPRSALRVIVSAVLVNLLNPKLTVFFLAFLPQFVSPDRPGAMLALSGVFMLLTFLVFAVYGVCAASVRDRIVTRPRVMAWIRRTFAASFLALGAKLALTTR